MARGRKTKYHASYARQAEVACREGGFTDVKLAKLFDVSRATINLWKKAHSEFIDSIKKGKDDFDSMKVENSLLKRALGYKFIEVTREPGGDKETGKIKMQVTKQVTKHVSPDTTAQIFFLKNRQPGRWRDVKDIKHSGEVKTPALVVEIARALSDEVKTS